MAITLDGTTGIVTPAVAVSGNISGNVVAGNIFSTTTSPPTIRNSAGTEIGTVCRAWVACNGSSTILGSFNVTSVTDVGTGIITVNFTNPMPDVNYAVVALNRYRGTGAFETIVTTGQSTSSASFGTADITSGAAVDVPYIAVAVFR